MNDFLVVGDLHGRIKDYVRVDDYAKKNGIKTIFQVGDTGVCWPDNPVYQNGILAHKGSDCPIIRYFRKQERRKIDGPTWYAIMGNHDNWRAYGRRWLKTRESIINYAGRFNIIVQGSYWQEFGGMAFLGGAVSSDCGPGIDMLGQKRPGRTQGKDWWIAEAPSQQTFQEFLDTIETEKPRYIFTHDGPFHGRHGINPLSNLPTNYVSQALENIYKLSNHKPEKWFFGHHHVLSEELIDNTTFYCCGLHGQGWRINDHATSPIVY